MEKRFCHAWRETRESPTGAILSVRHDSSSEPPGEPDGPTTKTTGAGGDPGCGSSGRSVDHDCLGRTNGKGRLPDETRSRVREVAERLGYRPSAAARTLRTGRSGLIGLTVTTYGEEPFTFTEFAYFAEMARAATSAEFTRGYALVVLPASSRHDVWGNIALDGTVVIDPSDHDPVVSELVRRRARGQRRQARWQPPCHAWVDNDHEGAVLGILDHLTDAGARRMACSPAPPPTRTPGCPPRRTSDGANASARSRSTRRIPPTTRGGRGGSRPAARPAGPAGRGVRALRPQRHGPAGRRPAIRHAGARRPAAGLLQRRHVYASTEPPITTLSLKPGRIGTAVVKLLIDAIEGVCTGPSCAAGDSRPT